MTGFEIRWPFQNAPRPAIRSENLRWTVTVAIETRDEALVEDMFGGVDRRDLIFGNSVAVRRGAVRRMQPGGATLIAEVSIGVIAGVHPGVAAALVAEWLTHNARKRADHIVIGGEPTPVRVGQIRRALSNALAAA